jgi:hypothetical protein
MRLRRGLSKRALAALGVVAATALAVNVNLLAARFYERWDVTSEGLYTLSEPTRRTLHSLSEPVELILLLSRTDPLNASLRHLLQAYAAETDQLRVRLVDPDQHPAEFSAIQKKYGVLSGRTEDGQSVTDASLVIAQGERHWFVGSDALVRLDPDGQHAHPALEQALTEGIANVLGRSKASVCFSRGHQEQGLNDAGPDGLVELRQRLEKNNLEAVERELGPAAAANLEGCRVLVLAGPRLPFAAAEAEAIVQAARGGSSVLALLSPMLGDDARVMASGLEPLAALADAELGANLVLETEAKSRVPRGLGDVFFAVPLAHAVTQGLTRGEADVSFKVLVSEAQSVRSLGAAQPLLRTSDQAFAVEDFRPLLERQGDVLGAAKRHERFVLAVARELQRPEGSAPARIVLVGSAAVAQNRSFRDPALYGDRLFVENAIAWLAARPALVSVPEKPAEEIGLALSEESLGEVLRYVLIYMPATAALLGLFVILRRRSLETRSRRQKVRAREDGDAVRP